MRQAIWPRGALRLPKVARHHAACMGRSRSKTTKRCPPKSSALPGSPRAVLADADETTEVVVGQIVVEDVTILEEVVSVEAADEPIAEDV